LKKESSITPIHQKRSARDFFKIVSFSILKRGVFQMKCLMLNKKNEKQKNCAQGGFTLAEVLIGTEYQGGERCVRWGGSPGVSVFNGTEADYEMDVIFHENGIISDMFIEYKDFSVTQKLVALEKIKKENCGDLPKGQIRGQMRETIKNPE